jgi:hypothetical protein
VNIGDPEKTIASREPSLRSFGLHVLALAPHVLEKQQRTVVHAWQARTEAAVEAALLVLPLDLLLLLLPVDAEGRVAQEVVEGRFRRELVFGEDVAEADVVAAAVVAHLLHEHVGRRRREGALVVVLSVRVELRVGVVVAHVALRLGQHTAGAASRVKELSARVLAVDSKRSSTGS